MKGHPLVNLTRLFRSALVAPLLTVAWLSTPAAAQDDILATPAMIQGCEGLVENAPTASDMQMGACAGGVASALAIGQSQRRVCAPDGTGVVVAARAVLHYIYERTDRRSQRFGVVALRALQENWPCRR
jgi:hypothetical protein